MTNGSTTVKPNILIILSDQLNARALDAYKNIFGNFSTNDTPNISALADQGVVFESIYTPTPLCRPARAAFWTGLFPHQTGVMTNGGRFVETKLSKSIPNIGQIFSDNGYHTIHIGKEHDHGALQGFQETHGGRIKIEPEHPAWPLNNDSFKDVYTTKKSVEFLKSLEEDHKPFLMVSDLNNPHNICGWVGKNSGPHKDITPPIELPQLPDNFEIEEIKVITIKDYIKFFYYLQIKILSLDFCYLK